MSTYRKHTVTMALESFFACYSGGEKPADATCKENGLHVVRAVGPESNGYIEQNTILRKTDNGDPFFICTVCGLLFANHGTGIFHLEAHVESGLTSIEHAYADCDKDLVPYKREARRLLIHEQNPLHIITESGSEDPDCVCMTPAEISIDDFLVFRSKRHE